MTTKDSKNLPTVSVADQILLTYEAEVMRRSLKKFIIEAWKVIEPVPFVDGWVVDAICEHLEALTRRDFRFLLVTVPPRHTKSSLLVMWAVWDWLHDPSARFLRASFNLDLAVRDNYRIREIIRSPWFQAHYGRDMALAASDVQLQYSSAFGISDDQDTKRFFMNDKLGYQMAVSVGGSVTGQGGSKLIIDDAHSADDAHSKQLLEIARIWFTEVWFNRMNDPMRDIMAIFGQRVHTDDVAGIVLRDYGADFVHLNLPAEFEPQSRCVTPIWRDPRTEEGELLWEARFDRKTIERYKSVLGPMAYSAQYQQRPTPAGGATFRQEWLRYFQELPDAYVLYGSKGSRVVAKSACWRFATMDLAISSKQTADYTVIQVWDVTPHNDLLLIAQFRGRIDNPEQQNMVRLLHMRLSPEFWVIESVAYQLSLIQQLRNAPINATDFIIGEIGDPEQFERHILWELPGVDAYLVREEGDYGTFMQNSGGYVLRVLQGVDFLLYAIEHQGYGRILSRRGVDRHGISIPIREYKPVRDKVSRASTPATLMANEQIYFLEGAPYVSELVTELLLFPNGSHDDQVDCLSMSGEVIAVPRAPLSDDEWSIVSASEMDARLIDMPETDNLLLKPAPKVVDPFVYAEEHGLWNT